MRCTLHLRPLSHSLKRIRRRRQIWLALRHVLRQRSLKEVLSRILLRTLAPLAVDQMPWALVRQQPASLKCRAGVLCRRNRRHRVVDLIHEQDRVLGLSTEVTLVALRGLEFHAGQAHICGDMRPPSGWSPPALPRKGRFARGGSRGRGRLNRRCQRKSGSLG